jgi:hypothetical protein
MDLRGYLDFGSGTAMRAMGSARGGDWRKSER